MCLTTKEKPEIKVAEEDIVCYKVVKAEWGLTLRTPFRRMKIELEREYTEPSFEEKFNYYAVRPRYHNTELFDIMRPVCYDFFEGMFHCIKSEEEAETLVRAMLEEDPMLKLRVIKAVIPKGSRYITGEFLYTYYAHGAGGWYRLQECFDAIGSEKVIYKSIY